MSKTKTELLRWAVRNVVSLSAGAVTKAVIQNNVATPTTLLQKATLTIGSFAIGGMVSDQAAHFIDDIFDDTASSALAVKIQLEQASESASS